MKKNIVFLSFFLIVTGILAQNQQKVAVFDLSGTEDGKLISDVRNTYYWGIVDYKGLHAIDINEVGKVLKDKNYQSTDDPDYSQVAELAQKLGAQYVLLSKVEKDGNTYVFNTELVDVKNGVVVSHGKGLHQYNFLAAEQALNDLLSDFSSIITTPSYRDAGWGQNFSETITDVQFEMIFIEGGTFAMGSDMYFSDENEKPIHDVTLNSYYIGKTEVTFALYDAYCEDAGVSKPSDESWGRDKHPVINIGKQDAVNFCKWLSKKTGMDYRLPTEAEWEYAARGGVKSKNKIYAGSDQPYDYAWFDRNSTGKSHPVGLKLPNELGIYDMSGNVLEICSDWYNPNYYSVSPKNNPQGPGKGAKYAVRGGSYYDCPNSTRVSFRRFGGSGSDSCSANLTGFRLVCIPEK